MAILAYNKIGFHLGPAGNPTGIGDYMRRLDAARVPFVMKSVDHYGPIYEGSQYTNADHLLAYRLTTRGQNDGFDYDVPDYNLSPRDAAATHWQRTKAKLPPEFSKRVWIEPINEVDKSKADWLGNFGAEIGQMAMADGYKLFLFGWSSGEPEPIHWHTNGMTRYLKLCAQHPDKLGVSLHEYSYVLDNIWRGDGHLIGRFRQLFEACDSMKIARPKTFISEWGWTLNAIPEPERAIADIAEVAPLYADYPEVVGAATWYLGGGSEWPNIANQTQRIIAPVTQFSLDTRFHVVPPEPPEPPPSGHRAIVVKAPQEVTAREWRGIADYSLQFKHTMTASHDDTITILSGGNSKSYAKIAYHTRASQQATIAQLDALGLSWQPVTIGGNPPVPEPPPPVGKAYTMFPYVCGDGRLYEAKNASGSQERFQSQGDVSVFYQTKNRHWEEMWVSGGFIWRGIDTSPGGGRFYELTEEGKTGSAWIPASWRVGESFTRSRFVQFYRCEGGQRVKVAENSGQVTDRMQFVAHHDSYTFRTGIVLQNVIELLWVNGGERYFYARGFGLVGWERQHQDPNTPAWSAISEIHEAGQRPDNEREPIC